MSGIRVIFGSRLELKNMLAVFIIAYKLADFVWRPCPLLWRSSLAVLAALPVTVTHFEPLEPLEPLENKRKIPKEFGQQSGRSIKGPIELLDELLEMADCACNFRSRGRLRYQPRMMSPFKCRIAIAIPTHRPAIQEGEASQAIFFFDHLDVSMMRKDLE